MIAERLGERQSKLERMAEMEHSQRRSSTRIRSIVIPLAIAACIAAFFVWSPFSGSSVSPWDEMGLARPELTGYRSATKEITAINKLIEGGDYDHALTKAEDALRRSDGMVEMMADVVALWGDDEGVRYDEQFERNFNSELRWTYIYLLLKTGKNKTARKELKRYLKDAEYCEHEGEARELLEKLKKS